MTITPSSFQRDGDVQRIEEDQATDSKLRTYHSSGYPFKACCAACADGFKEDRKAGAIYGTVEGCTTWEESSMTHRFCAYCLWQSVK